ncbi:MAG: hypothetical protein PVF73_05745 [Bacteroidales bacterium]|jgi:hypothetical protein
MTELTNYLVITGEGRNVGKTILACNIISKFSRDNRIAGLKITPHIHSDVGSAKAIITEEGCAIFEETGNFTRKDSSRMFAAGAQKAYLLQVSDDKLKKGIELIRQLTGEDTLVVCESAGILTFIKPGISLFLRHISCESEKRSKQIPDTATVRVVNFSINSFDLDLNSISIENNAWKLNE